MNKRIKHMVELIQHIDKTNRLLYDQLRKLNKELAEIKPKKRFNFIFNKVPFPTESPGVVETKKPTKAGALACKELDCTKNNKGFCSYDPPLASCSERLK